MADEKTPPGGRLPWVHGIKNFINEFCDHENIGIDPSITLVCALVLVLCLFPCFHVMADEKTTPGSRLFFIDEFF